MHPLPSIRHSFIPCSSSREETIFLIPFDVTNRETDRHREASGRHPIVGYNETLLNYSDGWCTCYHTAPSWGRRHLYRGTHQLAAVGSKRWRWPGKGGAESATAKTGKETKEDHVLLLQSRATSNQQVLEGNKKHPLLRCGGFFKRHQAGRQRDR